MNTGVTRTLEPDGCVMLECWRDGKLWARIELRAALDANELGMPCPWCGSESDGERRGPFHAPGCEWWMAMADGLAGLVLQ